MKIIATRRDIVACIIALYLLIINIICVVLLGIKLGIVIGNPLGLGTVTLFVMWSKRNKKVNNWLNHKL